MEMAAVDPSAQEAAIPFRVYGLEGRADTVDAAIEKLQQTAARTSEAIGAQAVTLARHEELLSSTHNTVVEVKTDVSALAVSVAGLAERVAMSTNRIAWTLVGFAFTVAGSVIAYIIAAPPA